MVFQRELTLQTHNSSEMHDLTDEVSRIVGESGVRTGIVQIFNVGSTGAIGAIEFEPGLKQDLPALLRCLIPPSRDYAHEQTWQDGNGHSHLQATLLGPSLTVPVRDSKLVLGTWQQRPIALTSARRRSAWRLKPGRRSTYRSGKTVQTTGTTSSDGEAGAWCWLYWMLLIKFRTISCMETSGRIIDGDDVDEKFAVFSISPDRATLTFPHLSPREEFMADTPFEIPQQIRDLTEQNIKQAHAAYEQLTDFVTKAIDAWTGAMPASPMAAGLKDFQDRAVEIAKKNAESAFALVEKIAKAQNFQEILTLQTQFAQDRMKALTAQTQELYKLIGETAQKLQHS